MTRYLTLEDALVIAAAVTGAPPALRDAGLLESALVRPQTSLFGQDAYPTLEEKAAALLQSIVGSDPLIDGNKRLGFGCMATFLHINGASIELDDESEASDLVIAVATGELAEIADIARAMRRSGAD